MKVPFITPEKLQEIIRDYPTPFHIYDEIGIRETARQLKAAFAWAPGFKEYFAVKATPTPAIMRILGEEDCGMDCSSLTELMLAQATGFRGSQIMFSSNVTPDEDFRLARELGATINLDDISHLDALEKLVGLPDCLSFRYNPGEDFPNRNAVMQSPAEAKYGLTKPQICTALLKAHQLGVRHFGIHAFLASNTLSDDYYQRLAKFLFQTVVDLRDQTGIALEFVNLSGGIGIPYQPDEAGVDIAAVGRGIQREYNQILAANGLGQVAIHTELGRFMTGPHGCLVATIIREKHIHKEYLGLDACAADLLRPAMYGAYHHITIAGKEHLPADQLYDVTGGLCENNDKFAVDRLLPGCGIGDIAIIHDTGAHGRSMGYNYNGKLRCGELLLRGDGSCSIIRRQETPADYFATLQGFGI